MYTRYFANPILIPTCTQDTVIVYFAYPRYLVCPLSIPKIPFVYLLRNQDTFSILFACPRYFMYTILIQDTLRTPFEYPRYLAYPLRVPKIPCVPPSRTQDTLHSSFAYPRHLAFSLASI